MAPEQAAFEGKVGPLGDPSGRSLACCLGHQGESGWPLRVWDVHSGDERTPAHEVGEDEPGGVVVGVFHNVLPEGLLGHRCHGLAS
jgi:hypothetical protein